MKAFSAIGFVAAVAVLAGACGNGNVNKNGGTSAGGSAGSSGGGTTGGSSGGSGGTNGAAVTYAGNIEAVASLTPGASGAPVQGYSLTADFYPNIGSGGAGCGGQSVNGCCYSPPVGGGAATPVSAGTLTLHDGPNSWPLSYDPTQGYGVLSTASWNPGSQLQISAAGDPNGVAGFTVGASAPLGFAGLSPDLTSGALSISVGDAGSDFILSWTPGVPPAQSLVVSLGPNPNATSTTPMGSVACTPADGDGTVTISEALLANFQPGQSAQLSISRVNAATGTPSNGSVIFQTSELVTANVTFTQ